MKGWKTLLLSDALEEARPGFACGEDPPDGVFQIRMNNVTSDGTLDLTKRRRVPKHTRGIEAFLLEPGDVVFNATNSPALVGKTAFFRSADEPTVFSNHFLRLRPKRTVLEGRFLSRWLFVQFQRRRFEGMCRQWVNQATVSRESLLSLEISAPPLHEQRRIAQILDQADALREKRRAALAQVDGLTQAIFLEMFGDPATNPRGWLIRRVGDVSDVQGGLQVSASRRIAEREVPYLRVANVFRGRLDLSEIKSIRASAAEIARTRLLRDDLLLVEGHGNPEEIGRCALWDGSILECVHQNHLIRARFVPPIVEPRFACEYINSPGGRRHLLRSGKTTSGLNTISVSEVRAVPIAVPPLDLQHQFASRAAAVDKLKASHRASLARLDALFASLQHRAFRGEL